MISVYVYIKCCVACFCNPGKFPDGFNGRHDGSGCDNAGMKISDRLRETIEEQIATGELAPGSALDEALLVERHGVSRTPVREALIQLAAEGLVELRPRRGAVVAALGPTRLIEMFEVMAELEAMCARQAARRATEADLAAIQAAHERCRSAAGELDPDAYFYANEGFHRAIYDSAHNAFLAEQAQALQRKLRPYRRLQLRVRNRLQRSFEEHQGIVDAIRNGDAELAVNAVRNHVIVQGERFADLLAGLRQLESAVPRPSAAPAAHTSVNTDPAARIA